MRLTLRTLLAYLDDILEDGDIQTLKAKIEESGRATQLIARIRNSVDHREIGALSPDAIGPLENANVMSEYLDSTLSPEQIAEIEQLCLDSDTSLAEAAACHQILTVVLGEPAQVKDSLRQKIYDLPLSDALVAMEQQTQPAADTSVSGKAALRAESVASLDRGMSEAKGASGTNGLEASGDELASPNSSTSTQSAGMDEFPSAAADATTAVRPVGPSDSGVARAASKIRSDADEFEGISEAQIVARTTRAMSERGDIYGGSIRPSRITPWLVTLALAGVVLYVLGQIFSPLSRRGAGEVGQVASQDIDNGSGEVSEPLPKLDEILTPPMPEETATQDPVDQVTPATESNATESNATASKNVGPTSDVATAEESTRESMAESTRESMAGPMATTDNLSEAKPSPVESTAVDGNAKPGENTAASIATGSEGSPMTDPIANTPAGPSVAAEETGTGEMGDKAMMSAKEDGPTSPVEAPVMDASEPAKVATIADPSTIDPLMESEKKTSPGEASIGTKVVAKLAGAGSLVLVEGVDGWSRLINQQPDPAANPKQPAKPVTTEVLSGQNIIAPALYRPILASDSSLEWVLAGPTRMRLFQDDPDGADAETILTELIDGRLLLASTEPSVMANLQVGPRMVKIFMPDAQTELAIEMIHFRPAGVDPLVPENRRPIYRIIATQNGATIESQLTKPDGKTIVEKAITLKTGQQWQARGDQPAMITTVGLLPEWVDDAAKKNLPIESARKGLLDFIDPTKPIEKSLREAMAFRRIEVAALAAETLLLLGREDVYFGSDGILSRPRQRLFWTEHFQMLRQHIASDAKAAASVQTAVARAELADSANLFRLLVGFSQEELANGGDEKLVEFLDSASMPVRVLAIENLKAIVGDDLGYRADQENANSRRADIKKWDARLRKGDIRYKP